MMMHIVANPMHHKHTKHKINCHLIQDKVKDGLIKIVYDSSYHQLAEIFTMSLGKGATYFFDVQACQLGALTLHQS